MLKKIKNQKLLKKRYKKKHSFMHCTSYIEFCSFFFLDIKHLRFFILFNIAVEIEHVIVFFPYKGIVAVFLTVVSDTNEERK